MKFLFRKFSSKGQRVWLLTRRQVLELLVLTVGGILIMVYAMSANAIGNSAIEPTVEPAANLISVSDEDYSRFQHTNPMHARLPCLLCHRRDDNSSRMGFPGKIEHQPCTGCHALQFSDQSNPICTICHVNNATGAMKKFPPLRSFNIKFDHGRHIHQTNCATCHKSTRRGVAFSIPTGAAAHVTCFQCHGPRSESGGTNIGSCSTCHQIGRPVRISEGSKAFSANFDHSEHISKGRLSCANCHSVRAGGARGRQVSSPLVSMHFAPVHSQSCGACHNSRKAFGANDFSNCKRCHTGKTFKF